MFDSCPSKNTPQHRSGPHFDQLIADTYKVGKQIGAGSYGKIHLGTDVVTGHKVAIKFELRASNDPQLQTEFDVYRMLKDRRGFPSVYHFGPYMADTYQVLVMQILGRNLEVLYERCGRRLTLKSMLFLTLQLLKRFETLHSYGILYRDVKPENFMLSNHSNTVYIIDFGLSKPFLTEKGEHIPFGPTYELTGTTRYMSVNAHLGLEQGRRDDLEALGYVFAYFLRGSLPWSGLQVKAPVAAVAGGGGAGDDPVNKQQQEQQQQLQQNAMIANMKQSIAETELCKSYPIEYIIYLQYVRNLAFDEIPDYEKVRNMFKRLFVRQRLKDDGIYDWNH